MGVKTAEEVKREFHSKGVTISHWAEQNGLSEAIVYAALSGQRKGIRGETHRAMQLLGLKADDTADVNHQQQTTR